MPHDRRHFVGRNERRSDDPESACLRHASDEIAARVPPAHPGAHDGVVDSDQLGERGPDHVLEARWMEDDCCTPLRLQERWRRRESNPRPQPHRMSIYKLRLPFDFARRPECSRPTVALAILQCRASGDWLSLCAEPVSWRRSEPRAQLGGASPTRSYELGSECAITRLRLC